MANKASYRLLQGILQSSLGCPIILDMWDKVIFTLFIEIIESC